MQISEVGKNEASPMKLCMVLLSNSTTIIMPLCNLHPRIDGAPAEHFYGEVAIVELANRDLARSRLFPTTAQDLVYWLQTGPGEYNTH